jgi:curved DNA-binding protein CbpA
MQGSRNRSRCDPARGQAGLSTLGDEISSRPQPRKTEAQARFKKIQQAYKTLNDRKKPDKISPAAFYRGQYPPSLFKNEHPFFSFYWAVKNHFNRVHDNRKVMQNVEKLDE